MNKGPYFVEVPFFALAPMANITTYPFASQAVQFGADLVWTPMVHTDTILNNWNEAEKTLNFKDIKNYIIQIVGSEPQKFADSVILIEKHLKPLGIDLNFACPDKNIVKSGCGGALLMNESKMLEIIAALKNVTKLPISVKTRSGWDDSKQIIDLAPILWGAGISLLTVHPRTVTQGFKGEADWGVIKVIKSKYPDLILCGSGDVRSWQEALIKQKETGCEGVIIGRGALGKPWIFEEIKKRKDHRFLLDEVKLLAIDLSKKADIIWGEKGIIESRTHYANYFRGFDGAQKIRTELMSACSVAEIEVILSK